MRGNVIHLRPGDVFPDPDSITDWDTLWCIPARDHRGHYEHAGFKLPPQLHDAMIKLYKSGLFPVSDQSAFCRAAVKLLVDLCHRMKPELQNSEYQQHMAISETLRQEERDEEFALLFARMNELVQKKLARGDVNDARQLLVRILEQVRKMPMGHKKNRWLSDIQQQYYRELSPYNIDWDKERQMPMDLGDILGGSEKKP